MDRMVVWVEMTIRVPMVALAVRREASQEEMLPRRRQARAARAAAVDIQLR